MKTLRESAARLHLWRSNTVISPIVECIDYRPAWEESLATFFEALRTSGDLRFFAPHPYDPTTLHELAMRTGRDIYCLLVEAGRVLGYGLLRGWDEGFEIPSLGIAIHPDARAMGLGGILIGYLECMASRRGARSVRLRVSTDNVVAIALYERRGYRWEADPFDPTLLVGIKKLSMGGN